MTNAKCRRVTAVWVAAVVMGAGLTGCGSQDEAAEGEQPVVAGVLLDEVGGDPVSGVELELVVRPSGLTGASAGPDPAEDLVALDSGSTSEDGSFELEALASELSPYASASGQVDVEIRPVGGGEGLSTTVRLSKVQGTGETTVEALTGVEMTLDGSAEGEETQAGS